MRDQQAGESHTVLSYLAQRTGGMFERNRNDLGTSIDRIMQDQQGYYLIGYRPDESTRRGRWNQAFARSEGESEALRNESTFTRRLLWSY